MAKVYVVTSGCYSDYSIEACFSTEEKAKEYIAGLRGYDIEEYGLDVAPPMVPGCLHVCLETGKSIVIEPGETRATTEFTVWTQYPGWIFNFWFPADWDELRCQKVAIDTYAQWVVKFGSNPASRGGSFDRNTMEEVKYY